MDLDYQGAKLSVNFNLDQGILLSCLHQETIHQTCQIHQAAKFEIIYSISTKESIGQK